MSLKQNPKGPHEELFQDPFVILQPKEPKRGLQPVWLSVPNSMPIIVPNLYFSQL